MSFQENIRNWVSIDNQLRILNEKTKILREEKNALGESLNHYIETENLHNATVEISDGKHKFQNTKVSQPLTFKLVEQCLQDLMSDEQVKQVIKYIKSKRETRVVNDIKRSYHN